MKARLILAYALPVFLLSWPAPAQRVPVRPRFAEPTTWHRELAAQAEKALNLFTNTPAHEQANFLRMKWFPGVLPLLNGTRHGTDCQIRDAALLVLAQLPLLERGRVWPIPPTCRIPMFPVAPVLDGRLDDEVWKQAYRNDRSFPLESTNALPPGSTVWYAGWDTTNLYFAFDCRDPSLLSDSRPRDGEAYKDDCVEVFLLPDMAARMYCEIVVNAAGDLYDAVHVKRPDAWGSDSNVHAVFDGLTTAVALRGTLNGPEDTDEGFSVEIGVPFRQLPGLESASPAAGRTIFLMLARVDRHSTGLDAVSFLPVMAWPHNIWNYAPARLE